MSDTAILQTIAADDPLIATVRAAFDAWRADSLAALPNQDEGNANANAAINVAHNVVILLAGMEQQAGRPDNEAAATCLAHVIANTFSHAHCVACFIETLQGIAREALGVWMQDHPASTGETAH